jgi:hypothetical protein
MPCNPIGRLRPSKTGPIHSRRRRSSHPKASATDSMSSADAIRREPTSACHLRGIQLPRQREIGPADPREEDVEPLRLIRVAHRFRATPAAARLGALHELTKLTRSRSSRRHSATPPRRSNNTRAHRQRPTPDTSPAGTPRRQPDPAPASCSRLISTRVCPLMRTSSNRWGNSTYSIRAAFAQVNGHLGLVG